MTENGTMGTVMPVAPAYGGMNGAFGGMDWGWIILLLLIAGNGFGGFGGGYDAGVMPYMWNTQTQNDVNRGFADAALSNQLTAMQNSINANESNSVSRAYAFQSQLAQCCCDNRLATNDLKYTIAAEACANRATSTANTQAILDKMCQMEIDAKNDRIAELERQITMANLAASQTAQTATLEKYLNPTPIPAYIVANPNAVTTSTNS